MATLTWRLTLYSFDCREHWPFSRFGLEIGPSSEADFPAAVVDAGVLVPVRPAISSVVAELVPQTVARSWLRLLAAVARRFVDWPRLVPAAFGRLEVHSAEVD